MAFYDRTRELAMLDEQYSRPGGQLFVMYGRRRVGKTVLLAHWLQIRGHRAIFWTADQTSAVALLRSFSQAVQAFRMPGAQVPPEFDFGNWELALLEVARLAGDEQLVLVLDEFTYLFEAESAITSLLQRLWDHQLKHTQVMLVITGSQAGMIEREVLSARAPLYQRATRHLRLRPLPYGVLHEFLPEYSAEDRVTIYGCVGGVPSYLELLEPRHNLETNLRRLLDSSLILDDAAALLRDQLDEPRNYVAIVSAIAAGYLRVTEIAKMSGLSDTATAKYLTVLQNLGIVERQVPATVSRPEHSKSGRYQIVDHYLRFYYRFIAPARSLLEQGLTAQVWANLRQHLPEFIGKHIFEELCREWVLRQADVGKLPFLPRRVGAYWGKGAPEIDVVAVNEDEHQVLMGECKWTRAPVDRATVQRFMAQATRVLAETSDERWRVSYAVFSKSGFTGEAERLGGTKVHWITLAQLDEDMRVA
ncbi:MAG: ATP-binding protein [Anaerolineales bacterium]|nr:ATP-binding protein [Anaerolineales bacterium]